MKSNVKSCLGKIFFFDFYSIRCKNEGVSALYTDVTVCILSDSSADFLPLNDSQLSFIFSSLGCFFHSELRSNAISASPILPLVSPWALWRKSNSYTLSLFTPLTRLITCLVIPPHNVRMRSVTYPSSATETQSRTISIGSFPNAYASFSSDPCVITDCLVRMLSIQFTYTLSWLPP